MLDLGDKVCNTVGSSEVGRRPLRNPAKAVHKRCRGGARRTELQKGRLVKAGFLFSQARVLDLGDKV